MADPIELLIVAERGPQGPTGSLEVPHGTLAARPSAASMPWREYFCLDNGLTYLSDGASWIELSYGAGVPAAASVTGSPLFTVGGAPSMSCSAVVTSPGVPASVTGSPSFVVAGSPSMSCSGVVTSPGFDPLTAGTMRGWFEADYGVEVSSGVAATNGQLVEYWRNRAVSGLDVSQATSGSRPTLNTTGVNGKATLVTDGARSLRNTVANLFATAGSVRHIFAIAKPQTSIFGYTILASRLSTPYHSIQLFNNGVDQFVSGDGVSGTYNVRVDGLPFGASWTSDPAFLAEWHFAGGELAPTSFVFNGTTYGFSPTDRLQPTESGTTGFEFFTNANNQRWTGLVAAILVYEGAMTSGNIAAVRSYLKTKYGTP